MIIFNNKFISMLFAKKILSKLNLRILRKIKKIRKKKPFEKEDTTF